MIKNLNPKDLYYSTLFVKDVVDEANEALTRMASKKIILAGSRGSGRSVVLQAREKDSFGTSDPAILTRFDAAGVFGTKEDNVFNREIMTHYYEILMSKKILNYIKQYYPQVFESEFSQLNEDMRRRIHEIDAYINNAYCRNVNIPHKLISGEISSEIMYKFRKATGAESVTLMIDRFDWTHNSDPRVQKILKGYFDMFEKVIITTDDKKANSLKGVTSLIDRGFEVAAIGYGQSAETVERIVRKRVEESNLVTYGRVTLPMDDVSREMYESITERCGGNIDTILNVFREAEMLYDWEQEEFNMDRELPIICTGELQKVKKFREASKPPKLHI